MYAQEELIKEIENRTSNQNLTDELIKQNSYTKEEQEYMNSTYYQNYQMILNNLNNTLLNAAKQLEQNYIRNKYYHDNAFFSDNKVYIKLSNIGINIPKSFLDNMVNTIYQNVNSYRQFDDELFMVSMTPLEYHPFNSSYENRVYKKNDGYQVVISCVENKLTNEKTK